MNAKFVCLGLLLLGSCFIASAQVRGSRRVRLMYGDYDCSCSYYCPSYGIKGGRCYDSDYWGWGRHTPQHCCVPSYIDYDSPDMHDGFRTFGRRRLDVSSNQQPAIGVTDVNDHLQYFL